MNVIALGVDLDGEVTVTQFAATQPVMPGDASARSAAHGDRDDSPRVLIVGGGELTGLRQIAARLLPGQPTVECADYLSALGELGTRPDWLPELILGKLEDAADELEATVTALRQLAPRTKIVLIAGKPSDDVTGSDRQHNERIKGWLDRALRAGADRCEVEPVNLQALETLMARRMGSSQTIASVDHAALNTITGTPRRTNQQSDQPTLAPQTLTTLTTDEQAAIRGGAWVDGTGTWRPMVKPEELVTQVGQALLQEVLRQPTSVLGTTQGLVMLGDAAGQGNQTNTPAAKQGDAQLGDVDLLDHILHRRSGFAELLLRLVSARAGIADAQWALISGVDRVQAQAQLPAGRVSGEVNWNGRFLGVLHAQPRVEAPTLHQWADWMSRWLAMEAQHAGLWDLALRDELTGAWNRRYFHRFLETLLQRAVSERFRVTLMLFDIDDFKQYNDRFGHAAGDDILREAARLMRSVVRTHDVVARIGGDEFAVIFWDAQGPRRPHSQHPNDVRQAAQRFQKAIRESRFPRLLDQSRGTLTISGGLASFPWDGRTPGELVERADAMCLESKRQGKNALTFGPGACREG